MKGSETSHQCALRELFEETGIAMNTSLPYIGHKKLSIGEYFVYEMDMETEASVNDTCEVCELGWFSLGELNNLNSNRDVSTFFTLLSKNSTEELINLS